MATIETSATDVMSPVDLFLQADIVVKAGDGRAAARQRLDLGDHRRPVAARCAGSTARTSGSSAILEERGYRQLLRGARPERSARGQGARRRHRRMAPLDRGPGGRQDGTRARLARRHALRRSRRRPTGSRRGSTSSPRSARSRPSSACSARSGASCAASPTSPAQQNTASRWSRRASPRPCSRPRSACSRRSRR